KAIQASSQISEPDYGALLDDMFFHDGGDIPTDRFIVPRIEVDNEHCGKPLNDTRLLALMGELEGRISGSIHYDNVAPCFLGGMQ
ncbi:hypothetical protein MJH54_30510, partial [Salmonella enterica subsp. enterica serovar Montevideo]|nr:hypothetical protein [Salmonella enterica subsp. enterica serovar Montevideo]